MPSEPNLIAALEATVHRVLDRLATDLADLGLSQGEINALFHLDGPKTVAELLAATGQRPSTLTGVITRLEKRGLVERQINPADRRSFLLQVTRTGARAAKRVRGAFVALEAEALGHVGARTPKAFVAVLRAFDEASAAR